MYKWNRCKGYILPMLINLCIHMYFTRVFISRPMTFPILVSPDDGKHSRETDMWEYVTSPRTFSPRPITTRRIQNNGCTTYCSQSQSVSQSRSRCLHRRINIIITCWNHSNIQPCSFSPSRITLLFNPRSSAITVYNTLQIVPPFPNRWRCSCTSYFPY